MSVRCLQAHNQPSNRPLTEALFAMDEPWRTRFLALLANRATNWTWDGSVPTHAEVETWLSDVRMRRLVTYLLRTWHRDEQQWG
jgi:hypothetical protein